MATKYLFGKTFNTTPGRLIFPTFTTPKAYEEGGKRKYSGGLVTKPTDRMAEIMLECNTLGQKQFGPAWVDKPDLYMKPFATGDEVITKIESKGKEVKEGTRLLYTGNIWITANSNEFNQKKQLLDPPNMYLADKSKLPRRPGNQDDLKAIEAAFYAGCYVRFAVTPMTYETGRSLGVKLILKGVQFIKDGDRLGGEDVDAMMDEEVGDDFEFQDEVEAGFGEDAGEVNT